MTVDSLMTSWGRVLVQIFGGSEWGTIANSRSLPTIRYFTGTAVPEMRTFNIIRWRPTTVNLRVSERLHILHLVAI